MEKRTLFEKFPNQSFHEAAANFLICQWPRATITEPEVYINAIARVLSTYSDQIVLACIDPANGIASTSERIPSIKVLTEFLIKISARMEQAAQYKQAPRMRSFVPDRPIIGPNLFVPCDAPKYDAMIAKAAESDPSQSVVENGRLCSDNVRRDGIWIPDRWYHPDTPVVRRVATSLGN